MNLKTKTIIFILFSVLSFLFSSVAHGDLAPGASITINIAPTSPAPGDNVTISAVSFSTDLNQAHFSWLVNGATRREGIGVKNFNFTAGSLGTVQKISVVIETKDIGAFSKEIIIAPAAIDVIEQADSYTPPFYKGKSLPAPQGNVTLIAMPNFVTSNGVRISPNNIVFKWKQGGRVLGSSSGLGANTLSIDAPLIAEQSIQIDVEASSPENSLSASATHILQAVNPEVILYENNPLLGVLFNRAIPDPFTMVGDELSLYASPYFFDSATNLNYGWAINNSSVSPTGRLNQLVLRKPDVSGSSLVSLTVKNQNKIFQQGQRGLQIQFTAGKKTVNF